jgi:hypothetical protein
MAYVRGKHPGYPPGKIPKVKTLYKTMYATMHAFSETATKYIATVNRYIIEQPIFSRLLHVARLTE